MALSAFAQGAAAPHGSGLTPGGYASPRLPGDAAAAAATQRSREMSKINTSLSALGAVIKALSAASERAAAAAAASAGGGGGDRSPAPHAAAFVPYRNSVLTWLLKDALGGNSVTTMVATVAPTDACYNETLSTLKYAESVARITTTPSAFL
jgi:kinesin family protein 1